MKINFLILTIIAFVILITITTLNYFFGFLVQDKITIDSKEYFTEIVADNKNLSKCNFYFILPKNTEVEAKAEFILNAPFKNCEKDFFLLVSKVFLNQKNSSKAFKMLNKENEFTINNLSFKIHKNEKYIKVVVTVI